MDIFLSNPIISDLQETYLKFKDIVWFKQKVMRKNVFFSMKSLIQKKARSGLFTSDLKPTRL